MLVCAGCATATEAFSALEAGAQWLKIFPSSSFGPDYIRALKAVLPPDVPVLAVGGVTPENLGAGRLFGGGIRQRSLSPRAAAGTDPGAGQTLYRCEPGLITQRLTVDAAAVAVERQLDTAQPIFRLRFVGHRQFGGQHIHHRQHGITGRAGFEDIVVFAYQQR